jgi:succinyl-CoA synthetase beta subunit
MQLQEFQAKKLLCRYSIGIPVGAVAVTPDEAEAAAAQLNSAAVFVKAQIEAGDRSMAGGIRAAQSALAAKAAAKELLGQKLVTSQTGPNGQTVRRVLVEARIQAVREFYLAMWVETLSGSIMLTAAEGGGAEIEQRFAMNALQLQSLRLSMKGGLRPGDLVELCRRIDLPEPAVEKFRELVERILRAFIDFDASLIEINPLALTQRGDLVAVDAKFVVDDNAVFRHPDLAELSGEAEADRVELQAQRHQINFVQMDGDVGTVVNGAGLGLATLDMIRAAGGSPANFMDIRTTAKSLDIAQGIGLVLDNPRAKVLLVNVFGGGMQPCDTIVDGLGIAFRRSRRVLPVVLRITGNNEDLARLRLANFNLPKTECSDMWQAVTRAVAIAQGRA